MRNRLYVPDFLFDFYNNRRSIGTPSALSNVSRAGLRKFRAKLTKCGFHVCTKWPNKQRLVDFECTDEQYTVSKNFDVRTNFSCKIDEVLILMIFPIVDVIYGF